MVRYFISHISPSNSSQRVIKKRIQFPRGSSYYARCVDVFLDDENTRLN